jgi:hypothetical protein
MVHGLSDPLEYFRMAPQYSLKGREHLIRCPTFGWLDQVLSPSEDNALVDTIYVD